MACNAVSVKLKGEGFTFANDIFRKVNGGNTKTFNAPLSRKGENWFEDHSKANVTATVKIAHDRDHPSRMVLPVVANPDLPAAPAACPSLRAEPCRAYAPATREPMAPVAP